MNKSSTVESLRKSGYKVKVTHYRNFREGYGYELRSIYEINQIKIGRQEQAMGPIDWAHTDHISPHGGYTEIYLTTPENISYFAASHCADDDNFNYAVGRNICFGRIRKAIAWDAAEKVTVAYRNTNYYVEKAALDNNGILVFNLQDGGGNIRIPAASVLPAGYKTTAAPSKKEYITNLLPKIGTPAPVETATPTL